MSTPVANVEVVNTTYPPFANATDYDLAFFTSTSNQSILFGASNSASNAILRLRSSNVEVFGNLGLTNTRVNMNGICINRATTSGTIQNISSTVTSIPCLASNIGNVSLIMGAGQSNINFVNSNNNTIASLDQSGNFSVSSIVTASNINSMVTLKEVTANGVNAGPYSGGWNKRSLNTITGANILTILAASNLTNNQFTLLPGTYHIFASAPGHRTGPHQCALSNNTSGGYAAIGSCEYAENAGATGITTSSRINDVIVVNTNTVFTLHHYVTASSGANLGVGVPGTGITSVHSFITIRRIQ